MTKKNKEALWMERMAMWKASGQSMREFALHHGWPPRQLAYWKKRLLHIAVSAPALIPALVKQVQSNGTIKLTARECLLELSPATPASWLAELLRSL